MIKKSCFHCKNAFYCEKVAIMRTFVVGDIHGSYKALIQIVQKINPTPADHLIFLGDYTDSWSEVVEVIDYLIALSSKTKCTFIRGNHDVKCYQWLKHQEVVGDWLLHGGKMTQEAYAKVSEEKINVHLSFLENLENYYLDKENRLFLHAGFTTTSSIEKEPYIPNYYWDRTLWEMAYAIDPNLSLTDKNYPPRLQKYKEIYIGHTATTRYGIDYPIQSYNLWNVDTGAAFTGKLSAIEIHTKEILQSDTVQDLYPNEKGRN